jgi:TATA-box binding protein (TBP) (component of TFIID and TFIIIB)
MEAPTLSTMVVIYKTNLSFDTTLLAEAIPLNETIIKVEKRGIVKRGESKRDKIKRRSKKASTTNSTGFCHNSLTIVMLNDGDKTLNQKEITVKIFQNGVFHMTGVLDEKYDMSCMRILTEVLWNSCQSSLKQIPEKAEILMRRVVLMNYTTKLSSNTTIARELLHTNIKNAKLENIVSHYDPDVYPGVKICIGKQKWAAKVFRTGNIILTGVVSSEECSELISQLLCLFEKVLPQKPTLESTKGKVAQLAMH